MKMQLTSSRLRRLGALYSAAAMAVVANGTAYGQTAAVEETAVDDPEILVTATKRAERVQDVPIAINAVGAAAILERRISSPDDLVRQFPNLSLKQTNTVATGFAIRGVGTQNLHLTAQQAVGQYIDEVSLVTPFTSQLGLFDMERIEVLRGPQNTLFGRNTTGGAVNYITNKPSVAAGFNGYGKITLGRFNRIGGEAAIGLPLSDTIAIRIAGQSEFRDGPFNNLVNGKKLGGVERYGARLGLSWEPTDQTTVLLSGHVGYNRNTRAPYRAAGRLEANGVTPCALNTTGTGQFIGRNSCVSRTKAGLINPSTSRWRDAYDTAVSDLKTDYEGGLLKIEQDLGFATLTSLTSYDVTKINFGNDLAGIGVLQFSTYQDGKFAVFSEEMRLVSTNDGPLRWILGGYYSHQEDNLATIVRNNAVGPPTLAPTPTVTLDQTVKVASVYGQLDFAITDKLNISGGLRWTHDKRDGARGVIAIFDTVTGLNTGTRLPADFLFTRAFVEQLSAGFTTRCAAGVVPCRTPPEPVTQRLSKLAGKIGVDYKPTEDMMIYASYATGFKAGSFDVRAQAAFNGSGNTPVRPESLIAYEAGIKSDWFDRMLQLNAAFFHYDWKDLQAFASVPGIGPAFLNVPKSKLTGQEIEVVVRPGSGFELTFSGAHLNSRVADVGTLGADAAIVGSQLQQSPKWSFNSALNKRIEVGENQLTFGANLRYTGSQNATLTEKPNAYMSPSTFLDLKMGYEFGPDRHYNFSIWVDNVTSEKSCGALQDVDGFTNSNYCIPNEGTALFGASFLARF